MSESSADFREMMEGFLAGDPVAAERLCRDYQSHILRVVRRRLMRSHRVHVDSLDVVHDVWASFFAQPPAGRRFDAPAALAVYLCRMAANKVCELARSRQRQKDDGAREEPLSGDDLVGPTPTPSDIVGAEDEWLAMLRGRPLAHQRILKMLRLGLTHREIAARLHTNEKSIQRLLRRVQLASES
ncbi:MAG: ECF-type sigma factor [Gemmataceae bacterium]